MLIDLIVLLIVIVMVLYGLLIISSECSRFEEHDRR